MNYITVIPARYASQRLPRKPLLDIAGMPMLQRVYLQVQKSRSARIVIATDHEEIYRCAQNFGAEVYMTRDDHASGTDRLAEIAERLQLDDDQIVVNVQGDEPLIPPQVIDQVAGNLERNVSASVATVSEAIVDVEQYRNPNAVKVVSGGDGMALYFSRATIPYHRDGAMDDTALAYFLQAETAVSKHIGIYAYRAGLLRRFVNWPQATLEKIEKLEQLRVLENAEKIHVERAVAAVPTGVDTELDLQKVRNIIAAGEQ